MGVVVKDEGAEGKEHAEEEGLEDGQDGAGLDFSRKVERAKDVALKQNNIRFVNGGVC